MPRIHPQALERFGLAVVDEMFGLGRDEVPDGPPPEDDGVPRGRDLPDVGDLPDEDELGDAASDLGGVPDLPDVQVAPKVSLFKNLDLGSGWLFPAGALAGVAGGALLGAGISGLARRGASRHDERLIGAARGTPIPTPYATDDSRTKDSRTKDRRTRDERRADRRARRAQKDEG